MKPIANIVLLATLISSAWATDGAPPTLLVRAMRSDEIAVATVKTAFLSGAMADRYGKINERCVKRVPYEDFTAGSAHVVESVLNAQEIATSLAFYQSDAGIKYVEGLVRRLRARQGDDSALPPVPGKEDITPAQLAAIADFSRTDLGRKVMGKELGVSPAAVALGREITEQIAAKCGGK